MLSGCDSGPEAEILPRAKALEVQAELSEDSLPNLAAIAALQISVDGRSVDVSSFKPATVGETGSGDGRAATIVGFSPKLDSIFFFSRDPENGEGHWLLVPIAAEIENFEFSFPVVDDDGSFESAQIKIHKLLR